MAERLHEILAGLSELLLFVLAALALDTLVVRVAGVRRDSGAYALLSLLELCVLAGLYVWWVRGVERRRVEELGSAGAWHLVPGVALGIVMFSAIMAVLVAAGAYRISTGGGIGGPVRATSVFLSGAVLEELAFRGILLRRLESGLGSLGALGVSALVFGLLHTGNPHATLLDGVYIALEGGLPLGAAYLATGSLWLPIGMHFGWNLAEGGIFGVRVSGEPARGWLHSTAVAGNHLAGGAFGAEGSIVAVVVGTVVGLLLLGVAVRRGRLRSWRRAA